MDLKTEAGLEGPEFFLALVGAIGSDMDLVRTQLCNSLSDAKYECDVIRASELLRAIKKEPWKDLPEFGAVPEDERTKKYMDGGDLLRRTLERPDAVALLAVGNVRVRRKAITDDATKPARRRAYVVWQVKRPEEVEILRKIYGGSFFLIGAYSPRETRLQYKARQIAQSRQSNQINDYLQEAQRLMLRDEKGQDEKGVDNSQFGQNVRDAFPMADVFVNASDPSSLRDAINRVVDLIFGYPYYSPTRDENGMFLAQAAALRSLSLSRQVGAAISTDEGDIVAVGTNEVPKAGGGLYWCDDKPDYRDFTLGYDSSDRMRKTTLAEVLKKLREGGWLTQEKKDKNIDVLVQEALTGQGAILKGTQLMNVIEYVRAEHAETAALLDAARRGVSVKGCYLYTNVFPCHDCTRHIVAAGIRRVYYIEPYAKSLAVELYMDSVVVDKPSSCSDQVSFLPFVGIAPRRYMELFSTDLFSKIARKEKDGSIVDWKKAQSVPRYTEPSFCYLVKEDSEFKIFRDQMVEKGLYYPPMETHGDA